MIVKTEEERQREKLTRKEEKKLSKFIAREEPFESDDGFDPVELRSKRYH